MGKILEEMKQSRNEVKGGGSGCGRDASLEFPARLGMVTLTGPVRNCLCGREVLCFASAPNQQSACSKKDGSHSIQD